MIFISKFKKSFIVFLSACIFSCTVFAVSTSASTTYNFNCQVAEPSTSGYNGYVEMFCSSPNSTAITQLWVFAFSSTKPMSFTLTSYNSFLCWCRLEVEPMFDFSSGYLIDPVWGNTSSCGFNGDKLLPLRGSFNGSAFRIRAVRCHNVEFTSQSDFPVSLTVSATVNWGTDTYLNESLYNISSKLTTINNTLNALKTQDLEKYNSMISLLQNIYNSDKTIIDKLDTIISLLQGNESDKPSQSDKDTISNADKAENDLREQTDPTEKINSGQDSLLSFFSTAPRTISFGSEIFNRLVDGKLIILILGAVTLAVFPALLGSFKR